MPSGYPASVTEKILEITLGSQTFAYLGVDENGVLINQGGNFESMGLPTWEVGKNISDSAYFLSGMLPMTSDYEFLPSVHTSDTDIIDIHLFQDTKLTWIIIEDRSDDLEWQILARQKSNELRLLEHKLQAEKVIHDTAPEVSLIFQALNMVAMSDRGNGSFELLKPPAPVFSIFILNYSRTNLCSIHRNASQLSKIF